MALSINSGKIDQSQKVENKAQEDQLKQQQSSQAVNVDLGPVETNETGLFGTQSASGSDVPAPSFGSQSGLSTQALGTQSGGTAQEIQADINTIEKRMSERDRNIIRMQEDVIAQAEAILNSSDPESAQWIQAKNIYDEATAQITLWNKEQREDGWLVEDLLIEFDGLPDTDTPIEEGGIFSETDFDGDGLLNDYEDSIGTDKYNQDSDGDGLSDYQEVTAKNMPGHEGGKLDPTNPDTNGDGLVDSSLSHLIEGGWTAYDAPTPSGSSGSSSGGSNDNTSGGKVDSNGAFPPPSGNGKTYNFSDGTISGASASFGILSGFGVQSGFSIQDGSGPYNSDNVDNVIGFNEIPGANNEVVLEFSGDIYVWTEVGDDADGAINASLFVRGTNADGEEVVVEVQQFRRAGRRIYLRGSDGPDRVTYGPGLSHSDIFGRYKGENIVSGIYADTDTVGADNIRYDWNPFANGGTPEGAIVQISSGDNSEDIGDSTFREDRTYEWDGESEIQYDVPEMINGVKIKEARLEQEGTDTFKVHIFDEYGREVRRDTIVSNGSHGIKSNQLITFKGNDNGLKFDAGDINLFTLTFLGGKKDDFFKGTNTDSNQNFQEAMVARGIDWSSTGDVARLGDGHDIAIGGVNQDDKFYGENGSDVLQGGSANNLLDGGGGSKNILMALRGTTSFKDGGGDSVAITNNFDGGDSFDLGGGIDFANITYDDLTASTTGVDRDLSAGLSDEDIADMIDESDFDADFATVLEELTGFAAEGKEAMAEASLDYWETFMVGLEQQWDTYNFPAGNSGSPAWMQGDQNTTPEDGGDGGGE